MATIDTPMLQFRTYIMLGFWDDFFTFSLFMRNPKMISKQTFRIDNTFTLDDVSSNFILNTFRFFHYLDYDTISMSFPLLT